MSHRAAVVTALVIVAVAGCTSSTPHHHDDTASAFRPSSVSIAPPKSPAWVTARACPGTAAITKALGVPARVEKLNDRVSGIGCNYVADRVSVQISVIEGDIDANRQVWTNPPPSFVYAAPQLAPGALIVYTAPGGLDQCLVAVDHPRAPAGTLTVQVTRSDNLTDPQPRCAPLGAILRALDD